MVRFVTIVRWTPKTARALRQRWATILNGTAPKVVLDSFAKYKVITQDISLPNNLSFMVAEVDDKDLVEAGIVTSYFQDVCRMESYTVLKAEDYMKVMEALPLEKVPKPERWTK